MAEKQTKLLGQEGEEVATTFLKKKGYKIVKRNFRSPFGEIDLIAWDKDTMVFIEVKTRKNIQHSMPFESINAKKMHKLSNTALFYLKKFKTLPSARFDVLNIYYKSGKPCIDLIKNAFELQGIVF